MLVEVLKSKIHRATVTQADLHYEGSITIDPALMKAANILNYEKVHVFDITNGNRLVTYAIKGGKGTGEICMNGAAARLIKKGHLIIIVAYGIVDEKKAKRVKPKIIVLDKKNRMKKKGR